MTLHPADHAALSCPLYVADSERIRLMIEKLEGTPSDRSEEMDLRVTKILKAIEERNIAWKKRVGITGKS